MMVKAMQATEEKEIEILDDEIDSFWKSFDDIRASHNIADYCEISLKEELQKVCEGMKCKFKIAKARLIRNRECFSYRWNTKYRLKLDGAIARASGAINNELIKVEKSIKAKLENDTSMAEEMKNEIRSQNIKLDGWYDKESVQKRISEITGEKIDAKEIDIKEDPVQGKEIENDADE
jgi:hypothetical protein